MTRRETWGAIANGLARLALLTFLPLWSRQITLASGNSPGLGRPCPPPPALLETDPILRLLWLGVGVIYLPALSRWHGRQAERWLARHG